MLAGEDVLHHPLALRHPQALLHPVPHGPFIHPLGSRGARGFHPFEDCLAHDVFAQDQECPGTALEGHLEGNAWCTFQGVIWDVRIAFAYLVLVREGNRHDGRLVLVRVLLPQLGDLRKSIRKSINKACTCAGCGAC